MKLSCKQIVIQNLLFNVPFATVMVLVSTLLNGKDISIEVLPMIAIAFVVSEILGAVIPTRKIAEAIGSIAAPEKNPMEFPQFFLVAAVLSVIFTMLMVLVMTYFGLKFDGVPLHIYWFAVLQSFFPMLLTAYICVLVFLPLSMRFSKLRNT